MTTTAAPDGAAISRDTTPLHVPAIDAEREIERIAGAMRRQVGEILKRRGVVVAMSGGVDSSVCAALAVRAFGPKRVLGVFMPEHDSDPASLSLASDWATCVDRSAAGSYGSRWSWPGW